MFILDIQSYRPCWQAPATVWHCRHVPCLRESYREPHQAHAPRLKCSHSSIFIESWHCTCNGLVFAQTHYGFLKEHTQFLQLYSGEESFVCLISAVCSLFEGTAKQTQQKMSLRCLEKRETLMTKFPSKDYSEGESHKASVQTPRTTWQCPGKWYGRGNPQRRHHGGHIPIILSLIYSKEHRSYKVNKIHCQSGGDLWSGKVDLINW